MKKIGLLFVCLCIGYSAFSQSCKYNNWWVSGGVGAQVYFSEAIKHGGLGDHMTPEFQLSVGYWFNDLFAVQLQYDGFSQRGFVTSNNFMNDYIYDPVDGDFYKQRFNYFNIHADVVFNLLSALNPARDSFYDLLPYVGVGYANSFKKNADGVSSYSINGGLINAFHLSQSIDVNLTLRAKVVNDKFNHLKGGSWLEGSMGIMAGLVYKF